MEKTLVLVKPDAVKKGKIGDVIGRFEGEGLRVLGLRMVFLSLQEGARFYQAHRGKPFYAGLVEFIASGPIVALVLEGEGAISRVRELMGSTNPAEAKEGTLRRQLGTTVQRNAVHGSDSAQSAAEEISFFFNEMEIFSAPPEWVS